MKSEFNKILPNFIKATPQISTISQQTKFVGSQNSFTFLHATDREREGLRFSDFPA